MGVAGEAAKVAVAVGRRGWRRGWVLRSCGRVTGFVRAPDLRYQKVSGDHFQAFI